MKRIYSKRFLVAALERATKTAAQAAVAILTAGMTGLLDVDWVQLASVSGLAAVVSLLTSIAGGAVNGEPSYGGEYLREYEPAHAAD